MKTHKICFTVFCSPEIPKQLQLVDRTKINLNRNNASLLRGLSDSSELIINTVTLQSPLYICYYVSVENHLKMVSALYD